MDRRTDVIAVASTALNASIAVRIVVRCKNWSKHVHRSR